MTPQERSDLARRLIAEHSLTKNQALTLYTIAGYNKCYEAQSTIAEGFPLDAPTLSKAEKQLVEMGLLERSSKVRRV